MKIKNVSPLGDLSVPALGLTVEADAEIEVPADAAWSLLAGDNFEPADTESQDLSIQLQASTVELQVDLDGLKKDELIAYAAAAGVEVPGGGTKAEILAAIKEYTS